MKKITYVVLSLSVLFLTANEVSANTVVRSGETVSIAEEQLIEGDFYSAAGKISISGEVAEDLVVAGGQVTLNGGVGDNAFIIAGQTDVHGTVGDDLRIISGETTIAEPVMGDLLVVGGTVNILSTASISGDVLVYASDVTIEGSVGGDVIGTVGTLRIDAKVAGDVDVAVEQLTLGDRSVIDGSVRYVSNEVAVRGTEAVISGDLSRSDPVIPGTQPTARAAFVPLIVLLFSALLWYLVSRKSLNVITERALQKSPRPFLLGLLTVTLAPLGIVLLFVSMIGSLVGVTLFAGYVLLVMLSVIGTTALLGRLCMRLFTKTANHVSLLTLVSGAVAVALLMLLPLVGQIILLVSFFLLFGAMIDMLLRPTLTDVVDAQT